VLTVPQPSPTPRPTRSAAPAPGATAATPDPGATPDAGATPPATVPAALPTFAAPPPTATAAPADDDEGGLPWPWIAGFALLVALLAGGWVWLRRRISPGGTVLIVPEIEKPRVPAPAPRPEPAPEPEALPEPAFGAEPDPTAAALAQAQAAHPLHIVIAPLKLTQTVMNATLAYQLTLSNKGEAPLEALSVAADLVAAHVSLPREALMAAPDTELPERHAVPSLAPGETVELKGELRLPLAQAMPIRQGQAVVFVPLARFRAAAEGGEPRCFTVVVGQPSPRGAIQPIRLDLGPRSTDGLTGHAF
jgi:hypothetical protein